VGDVLFSKNVDLTLPIKKFTSSEKHCLEFIEKKSDFVTADFL